MIAFLFPGQGSQQAGMGRTFLETHSWARDWAHDLSQETGINLIDLIVDMSDEQLTLTENAQPAIVFMSLLWDRLLREQGVQPQAVAGHSVGEYSALVSAGVILPADALRAVRLRGSLMQKAVSQGEGGMLAILGLNDEEVEKLCLYVRYSQGGEIWCANFNTQGQVVVSGKKKDLNWLTTNASRIGEALSLGKFKVIPLKVSAPFHCPLMGPAEEGMAEFLRGIKFQRALIPVFQNVDGRPEQDPEKIREKLIHQVSRPVRWLQTIQKMSDLGFNDFWEVGYGQVLQGLFKKSGVSGNIKGSA